jgi:hypothetical protein
LVHNQLKFGWSLNRQFGRIGTTQNQINIGCSASDNLPDYHPVRHEAACLAELAKREDRRKSALRNQLSNPFTLERSDRIRQKNKPTIRLILERANQTINVGAIAARCLTRGNP